MSDGLTVTVDQAPLQRLMDMLPEYQAVTGRTAAQGLREMARQVGFAMFEETRKQPPRPREGSITKAARDRGFTMDKTSESYLSGMMMALKLLGNFKSGYFRIIKVNGRDVAQPIVLGKRGRVIRSSRKALGQRGTLLHSQDELTARGASIPSDAVRLNIQSLAVLKALMLRETAGMGGYMSRQWLTSKYVKAGKDGEWRVTTKDKKDIGEVIVSENRVVFNGRVEHSAQIAARENIVNKAFTSAQGMYLDSMARYVARKAKNTLSKLAA